MTASDRLTAVIVDDEQRAQERLVRMLGAWPRIDVVAQAADGATAVRLIDEVEPDIVFLDVQMPGMDGFEVLRHLARPPRHVVFTTAYDRYALDAFEVGAVDYLLKPFSERELARAVSRAFERSGAELFRQSYERLLQALDRPQYLERIPVTYLRDIVLLPVHDITAFTADHEMVAIRTAGQSYASEMTLAELEQRLNPALFFRAHRSAIVNLERLVRLEPLEGGRFRAVMDDGSRVDVSRTASRKLRGRLGL
jgi:DNA-binding LytR/AlgR family response regulator